MLDTPLVACTSYKEDFHCHLGLPGRCIDTVLYVWSTSRNPLQTPSTNPWSTCANPERFGWEGPLKKKTTNIWEVWRINIPLHQVEDLLLCLEMFGKGTTFWLKRLVWLMNAVPFTNLGKTSLSCLINPNTWTSKHFGLCSHVWYGVLPLTVMQELNMF